MFPRLYEDATCPLEGYEGYVFRVLSNPTGAIKVDWAMGHLGTPGCTDCKERGGARVYCKECAAARAQMGRAAVAIFGESRVAGFDFATEDAALASLSIEMPDEFLAWLYISPGSIWEKRAEQLKKMVSLPLAMNGGTS